MPVPSHPTAQLVAKMSRGLLEHFSNWYRAKPQPLSGFFLKKKPPCTLSLRHVNSRNALMLVCRWTCEIRTYTNGGIDLYRLAIQYIRLVFPLLDSINCCCI